MCEECLSTVGVGVRHMVEYGEGAEGVYGSQLEHAITYANKHKELGSAPV